MHRGEYPGRTNPSRLWVGGGVVGWHRYDAVAEALARSARFTASSFGGELECKHDRTGDFDESIRRYRRDAPTQATTRNRYQVIRVDRAASLHSICFVEHDLGRDVADR